MSIKCGFCKMPFSTRKALQDHLELCQKGFIQVEDDPNTPEGEVSPKDKPPSETGRVFECGHCGTSFTGKESLIMHRVDCPLEPEEKK